MNLSEISRKVKEGLKGTKVLEHHQTPPKWHLRLMDNCLEYVHQFLTSNPNFSNLQNFSFP